MTCQLLFLFSLFEILFGLSPGATIFLFYFAIFFFEIFYQYSVVSQTLLMYLFGIG